MSLEARIVNFELGGKRQYPDRVIIEIEGVKSLAEAMRFINKKVVWITPTGKKIIGKIRRPHGRKGKLLAVFRKGLPGQALGTKVLIIGS
ncbi:MAG: 50S ribosomal protein L35ae [Thermoprotei archaeon]|nr:MAG: 50S ribosomal protein L35ae [Thermoprotei archaeon]RLE89699.1 MAG: 50S ribosomal protein L35ae [Thermoprotei archaeon]